MLPASTICTRTLAIKRLADAKPEPLPAAQSFQAVQEASQLGHGLLTYALVNEGLRKTEADVETKDGQVFIRECLDYATRRVPEMQIEEMQRALTRGTDLTFREEMRG